MNTCLIGFNLTNLLLAILLSKKGFEVDIIFDEKNKSKTKGNREDKIIDGEIVDHKKDEL